MNFLAPIAGLIAGGIGSVLVLLYWMLRLRRRSVRVSSTLLWKRAVRDVEGNIPWQMVRPSVLLFMQLIAVVLLAIALARPTRDANLHFGGGEVVVVIDAGASMNALADLDGRTRLELAKRDASKMVRSIGGRSSTTKFRVIRAGPTAQMVSGVSGSWRQARAGIESIQASDAPSDLNAAIELAISTGSQELSEDGQQAGAVQTVVFSDATIDGGAVSIQRPTVESESQDPRGNLGIVLVGGQRDQADPSGCRVFVTVAGVVGQTTGVQIKLKLDDAVLASKSIELIPDDDGLVESATTLACRLDSAGVIEVSISREDVLDSDNRVWVWLPDPEPIVTTVVAPDGLADPLLIDVLSAVTGGLVAVVEPGEAVASGTGMLIYDRIQRDPRALLPTIEIGVWGEWGVGADQNLRRVLTWDRSHPVMRDVDLSGLSYFGEKNIEGTVLASGESGALIVESAEAGVRHLAVGFALQDSNWGVQVSMPMFFANAIQYLLPGTSGTAVIHRTGEPIGEGGSMIDHVGQAFVDGEEVWVSLLDRDQTIRAGQTLTNQSADNPVGFVGASSGGRVELWRWFVLAGLVVLTLEWTLDLLRRRVI